MMDCREEFELTQASMEVAWLTMMRLDLGDPLSDKDIEISTSVIPQFLKLMKGSPTEFSLFRKSIRHYNEELQHLRLFRS
jgi:hypothetical protein